MTRAQKDKKQLQADSQTQAPADHETQGRALMRLEDQPPTQLPAIILDDLVPFPGPIVPILLDRQVRRDAILNAKENNGFAVLINRSGVGTTGSAGLRARGHVDADNVVSEIEAALARAAGVEIEDAV